MLYRDIVKNNNVPFDEISIPSKGIFYKDKKETFLVKYVTAKEENLLTSPTLIDSGKALEMLMSSCLLDWDGDIDRLLIGDRDAFMVYLRSTSYGDKIPYDFICSNCKIENKASFNLSELEMKDVDKLDRPDENLEYTFTLSKMKINNEDVVVKFRPKTLGDERSILKIIEEESKSVGGIKIDNRIEATYRTQISSINGINNEIFIKKIIKGMSLSDSSELRGYMKKVEPGVQNELVTECESCGHSVKNIIPIDGNFFGLDVEYRQHMMNEIFLITYYYEKSYIPIITISFIK